MHHIILGTGPEAPKSPRGALPKPDCSQDTAKAQDSPSKFTQVRGRSWLKQYKLFHVCRVSSQLAMGGFGPICGGKLDGVPVAVKKLELTRSEEEEMVLLREAFVISQFNHSNVVKVLGVVLAGQRVRVQGLRRGKT